MGPADLAQDCLRFQVGESRQLRPPSSGVARWTSSAPAIVSTTDEDLVSDKPGGYVVAIKVGRARITAFGFDNATRLLELDVEVVARGDLLVVRLAKDERVPLPANLGGTGWAIANARVAEIDGRDVRGLGPGVTTARAQGGSAAECVIEVTGVLDAGVNQSVDLAVRFPPTVRSWRTSCPSEVQIDATGKLTTGNRPRTVEVFAELATGNVFAFNVRIRGEPSASRAAATTPTDRVAAPASEPPPSPPFVAVPVDPTQQQSVLALVASAEGHIVNEDWVQAGAAIAAARLAAVTDAVLAQRVEEAAARIRTGVRQRAAVVLTEALRAYVATDYARAHDRLESPQVPAEWQEIFDSVRRLVALGAQFALEGDDQTRQRAEQHVLLAWNSAVQLGVEPPLPLLAQIGLSFGSRIVGPVVDALSSPALVDIAVGTRQALGACIADTGALGVEAVIGRLADASTQPGGVSSLLHLLPDLSLHQHGSCIIRWFNQADATRQDRFAERVAMMRSTTPQALFDLLAGVLNRMPPDPRVAAAIQAKVRARAGSDELESIARVWAVRGHRSAQRVLQGLYDYDSRSFGQP